jgi:hypothetical protein
MDMFVSDLAQVNAALGAGWAGRSGAGNAEPASGLGLDRHQRFQIEELALQMLEEIDQVRRPTARSIP